MSRDMRVYQAMQDDNAAAELISIARLHCELALEHGKAITSPDRRRAIIKEIDSLRAVRDAVLERFAERDRV